ncbi:hypothetical protein KZZ52_35080 [Dactylosporangium sp. AC04546]|uniref:hypothetical protein n=1 Tax=Dactylosporangium sp. AC04546 TaxID=2862460 RepID=UPI001EE1300A|nr:hypothetical protein [Dactylosporangium sp. AC04546]WVK79195.1 hypothetical protein KZZ52_35080 [Dactylosporangium sp. AC04546]
MERHAAEAGARRRDAGVPRGGLFTFTVSHDRITGIAIDADPDRLHDLEIVFLSTGARG